MATITSPPAPAWTAQAQPDQRITIRGVSWETYLRLVEEKFRPILTDLEEEVFASGLFEPRVVYGYFPAQSEGNDVIVYEPERLGGPGAGGKSEAGARNPDGKRDGSKPKPATTAKESPAWLGPRRSCRSSFSIAPTKGAMPTRSSPSIIWLG